MLENSKLSQAVKLALVASAVSFTTTSAVAADEATADGEVIEKIQVTGSRIKRNNFEGPAPITVLTADDISAKGFTNMYEAIQNLTAGTGSNQGQAITNSFTPNAETVNLRGLGANRTLVLLNGQRVANYPRAFNSQNNVFNLATIPAAAVERIEIITGGNSAIYGSDAVAGVMNIITKKNVEDITVTVHHNTSHEGGGDNSKLSIVGGLSKDNFSWTYAVEYSDQDMLKGSERDWLDDYNDGPATETEPEYQTVHSRSVMSAYWAPGFTYQHPDEFGENLCDQWEDYELAERPSRGFYCGRDTTGDSSYINERENLSVYSNFSWEFSENHALTADVLYWTSDAANQGGYGPFWSTSNVPDGSNYSGQWIWDQDNNRNQYFQRTFTPEEVGDSKGHFEDDMLYLSVGLNGVIFEDYDYSVTLSHSKADNKEYEWLVAADKARDYFLGPAYDDDGNVLPEGQNGVNYSPNYDRFWSPLTEEGRAAIMEQNDSTADSSVSTLSASISGSAFELPAGDVGFAVTAEYSTEEYEINVNPRTLDPTKGWGNGLTGTEGDGERDRYGIAVELEVPITEQVTANIAGRYDYYNDKTDVDGAFTYQLGLQYRPTDDLLVRGSYATSFRAPDIHQVNAGPSGAFNTITDYYLEAKCLQFINGQDTGFGADGLTAMDNLCDPDLPGKLKESQSVESTRTGNTKLKEETGYSATVGFSWDVTEDLNWTMDYYKIQIKDQVESWNVNSYFQDESNCRQGINTDGIDCDFILSRVERYDASETNVGLTVKDFQTTYVNQALNEQAGIDMELTYTYDAGNWGEFTANLKYTHVLEVVNQEFPGEPVDNDYRDDFENDGLRSKLDNTFSWKKDDWRVTLTQMRYGSTWNAEDPDPTRNVNEERRMMANRLAPWLIYNIGVNYDINDNHSVRLGVNNIRDSKPRNDGTFDGGAPWYDDNVYPVTIGVMGRTFAFDYVGKF
ncbi:TonB-dependent receptor [Thalassomonas viridans]|uniref:TonB-dependent receptor n=1 Tax=Thalassomonas viridans TaxID=137584 RepID=A0AAE9YYJ9_9GAMM|nr:TonB-dependent receptor [Thalassomonas viridans]WDE03385.1 TonB-dependent receptor [Thalassomonas viridans]